MPSLAHVSKYKYTKSPITNQQKGISLQALIEKWGLNGRFGNLQQ